MIFLCAKWCDFGVFKDNIHLNMLEFRMRSITKILLDLFFIQEQRDSVFCFLFFSRNLGILVN